MDFPAYISDIFALPASAVNLQKLPKTFFYNNFDLLPVEKKLIEKPEIIEAVEVLATVNQRTSNISSIHTEEETFDEVIFLLVKTSSSEFDRQKHKIAEILHKYIPNHLMVAIFTEEKMMLSIAEKRVNQNDANRRVVEMQYDSQTIFWKNPEDAQKQFLESLNFTRANTINLQQYYHHFVRCFSVLEVSKSTGQFRMRTFERSKKDVVILNKIREVEEEIVTLQHKAKKETQLNEILYWNTLIKNQRQKLQELKNQINTP